MDGADRGRGGVQRSESSGSFPRRPPVEIIERDGQWIVEEYRGGRRDGETYATYDERFDAISGARNRMDAHDHPCLVRWDDDDVVGNIYWNPFFERLEVRYDRLLDVWAVVPAESYHRFATAPGLEAAVDRGREVQRRYDFEHLVVYDRDGTERERIDHRFLRRSLAESGVRFEADGRESPDADGRERAGTGPDASADGPGGRATSDASGDVLAGAGEALTDVRVESTGGAIHRYRGTWAGDRPAIVAALAPEHGDHRGAVDAFTEVVDRWESVARSTHVTTVFDSGTEPTPWVAFRACDLDATDYVDDLAVGTQLRICKEVAIALEVAHQNRMRGVGVRPGNVSVVSDRESRRITLSGWGLCWRVATALDADFVTPYTAPEQLDGRLAATTGVYQLGAFAYRLLTGLEPFSGADLAGAIRDGTPPPPSRHRRVPETADEVLARAMATEPGERYAGVDDLYAELLAAFQ